GTDAAGPSTTRLSVIVPTRDTRSMTLRCLECVSSTSPPGAEVIVVDDGSRDGTAEAVQVRWPAVRVVRLDPSRGFGGAANAGLAAGSGEVLLLLHNRTEGAADAPPRLLEALERHPRLGIAGADLRFPDGRPQWSGARFPTALWLLGLSSGAGAALRRVPGYRRIHPLEAAGRGAVDWVSGAAMAIRRAAWVELGPLDERFAFYAQDLDLCARARGAGWDVALVPGARVVHHGGATIGEHGGATAAGQHPERLWRDLLQWVGKSRGPAAA